MFLLSLVLAFLEDILLVLQYLSVNILVLYRVIRIMFEINLLAAWLGFRPGSTLSPPDMQHSRS